MTSWTSIHPPRLAPAVAFARIIIRRNVIPVLVEVDLAVMLRHVDFEFLRRSPPLPAVVGIAHAVVAFRESDVHQRRLDASPYIKPAKQQSPQVRHISHAATAGHR